MQLPPKCFAERRQGEGGVLQTRLCQGGPRWNPIHIGSLRCSAVREQGARCLTSVSVYGAKYSRPCCKAERALFGKLMRGISRAESSSGMKRKNGGADVRSSNQYGLKTLCHSQNRRRFLLTRTGLMRQLVKEILTPFQAHLLKQLNTYAESQTFSLSLHSFLMSFCLDALIAT